MATNKYTPKTKIEHGGKCIGVVTGDTLKKVIRNNHYIKYPRPGIALDVAALDQAEQAGATRVQVVDRDSGEIYLATIEHIRAAGMPLNRGYGNQICLPLNGWIRASRSSAPARQLDFLESAA